MKYLFYQIKGCLSCVNGALGLDKNLFRCQNMQFLGLFLQEAKLFKN